MHEPSDILQIGKGSKMSGPIQMLISTPFDVIKVFFQVFNERIFFLSSSFPNKRRDYTQIQTFLFGPKTQF